MRELRRRLSALEGSASLQIDRALARLSGEDARWFLSRPMTADGMDFDMPRWTDADLHEAQRRLGAVTNEEGPNVA